MIRFEVHPSGEPGLHESADDRGVMQLKWLVGAAVAASSVSVVPVTAPSSAQAAPINVYAFVHGCYALQDTSSGRFVTRDVLGYQLGATSASTAMPFRMQATALGRYLFYGTGGQMMSTGLLNSIPSTTTPVSYTHLTLPTILRV